MFIEAYAVAEDDSNGDDDDDDDICVFAMEGAVNGADRMDPG